MVDYKDNLPVFDETQLCFDPNERLFIRNSWQTDLIPRYGNSKEVDNQIDLFLQRMTEFREKKVMIKSTFLTFQNHSVHQMNL